MSKTVDSIRKQIDTLDNKIHDLLMERADLVLQIGAEKKRHKLQVVQPDREIIMLRRLLDRHEGPLPKEAVVRIWRELVGAVSLLQTGLKVVVTVPQGDEAAGLVYWDLAKDYFSSVLPMLQADDTMGSIAMVREGEATFGVLPWPENEETNPWWRHLLDEQGETPMRITARLPLGEYDTQDYRRPDHKALAVSRLRFDPSGEDCSFVVIRPTEDISRARLVDKLNECGMEPLALYRWQQDSAPAVYLAEVMSYVAPEDGRLSHLSALLGAEEGSCLCLGGYPVPPVYKDTKKAKPAAKKPKAK